MKKDSNFYAHSLKGQPPEKWQPLEEHLKNVAEQAASFASEFGGEKWAYLAGLWHDLGKYNTSFQKYMFENGPQVEHAVVGGRYVTQFDDPSRKFVLQVIITCHHTGLQNNERVKERIKNAFHLLQETIDNVPGDLLNRHLPYFPRWLKPPFRTQEDIRHLEFWIRMLHSCLVDADWLDAEKRNLSAMGKRPEFPELSVLRDKLDQYIDSKVAKAKKENWTQVNRQREIVLKACRNAANEKPGFFSLTVPTGGGKTYAAMSFALNHAVTNDMRRVIVVIPYTSIISQNAKVYSDVFGQHNVIEHHTNLSPERDTEWNRLATENWDAPIIVTTNVQFFESLFARKNSKLRKIHNIPRSVIILDEVQCLPPALLYPILDGLKELQQHYGCSIVLSTATQPALNKNDVLKEGLIDVQEIIPDTVSLVRNLNRVNVEWKLDEITEYGELARQIIDEGIKKVLIVTHKRKDARTMTQFLPSDTYHLSAAMCPAHKQDVIDKVSEEMKVKNANKVVRLVSTQLIEAGVDIDFPVVFRALAGLDSLSQTAGRCNREGKLVERGRFVVFCAPTEPPPGILRIGKDITFTLINSKGSKNVVWDKNGYPDLTRPENYQTYFWRFYSNQKLDAAGVQTCRERFNFADVADNFRMIDNETYSVVVPYKNAYDLLKNIRRKEFPSRDDYRALQPYIVQVYKEDFVRLIQAGAIEPLFENSFYYLTPPYERLYDKKFGLIVEEENIYPDETALIL